MRPNAFILPRLRSLSPLSHVWSSTFADVGPSFRGLHLFLSQSSAPLGAACRKSLRLPVQAEAVAVAAIHCGHGRGHAGPPAVVFLCVHYSTHPEAGHDTTACTAAFPTRGEASAVCVESVPK